MNGHALNAAALNSGPITAQTVLLPSSSTGVTFTVFERASVYVSGSTGISFATAGDIAKVALIGTGAAGITFSPSATLSVFSQVAIGAVSTGIAFSLTGVMSGDRYLPAAAANLNFGTSGSLTNFAQMQAVTDVEFNATVNAPRATKYLQGATDISLDTSGLVTSLNYFGPTSVGIQFTVVGQVGTTIRMAGSTQILLNVSGQMSNNPSAVDAEDRVVVRPYVNRVAVR